MNSSKSTYDERCNARCVERERTLEALYKRRDELKRSQDESDYEAYANVCEHIHGLELDQQEEDS